MLAEVTGFEPAISALTGQRVRPLHHTSVALLGYHGRCASSRLLRPVGSAASLVVRQLRRRDDPRAQELLRDLAVIVEQDLQYRLLEGGELIGQPLRVNRDADQLPALAPLLALIAEEGLQFAGGEAEGPGATTHRSSSLRSSLDVPICSITGYGMTTRREVCVAPYTTVAASLAKSSPARVGAALRTGYRGSRHGVRHGATPGALSLVLPSSP